MRLAIAMHRAGGAEGPILACDEFAAVLDRITAKVMAHALRRAIDSSLPIAAVVASSHDDLIEALAPDVVVRCDFGRVSALGNESGASAPEAR